MENPGFRRLSEELAVVVKVVTQAIYFKEPVHLKTGFPTVYGQILAPSTSSYL